MTIIECPKCGSKRIRTYSQFVDDKWIWKKGCNDCPWETRDEDEEKLHPEYYTRTELSPAKISSTDIFAWHEAGYREIYLTGFDHLINPTPSLLEQLWKEPFFEFKDYLAPKDLKTFIVSARHHEFNSKEEDGFTGFVCRAY